MEYNDINIIKPVESLDNITGIAVSRRREERKHRPKYHQENQNDEKTQNKTSKVPDEDDPGDKGIDFSA